jgi:hypothetical protein
MIGRLLIFGAGISAASAQSAMQSPPIERFRLICTGDMASGDASQPATPLLVDGMVDLGSRSVRGFGLSGQPIQSVSDREIAFGTDRRAGTAGLLVEGSIDRATWRTAITVRAPGDPAHPLMAMRLDCAMKPPVY